MVRKNKRPQHRSWAGAGRTIFAGLAMAALTLACASSGPTPRSAPGEARATRAAADWPSLHDAAASTDRLIIVTFEPIAVRGRNRPGSSPKGYQGGGGRYKTQPSSVRTAQRLETTYGIRRVDEWPIPALDVHCVVFRVPDGRSVTETISLLGADARVKTVQPLHEFELLESGEDTQDASGGYDDPYLRHQHGLQSMQIETAHGWATGDGIRVAVIDTGVDLSHPDLAERVRLARDCVAASRASGRCVPIERPDDPFSRDAHGTAIAGVIASAPGNGEGIVGVAPDVEILALKACWYPEATAHAVCNTFTLAKAIQLALDEDSHILNLSLSGPADPLLHEMVEAGIRSGVIVVGAVRPGAEDGRALGFPACHQEVITVNALPEASARPAALRSGDPLLAPGNDVLTTQPGGKYDFVTGSSFAAAHVTGLAALMLEKDDLPSARLREILRTTSDAGTGVNACGALASLLDRAPCQAPRLAPRAADRPSTR